MTAYSPLQLFPLPPQGQDPKPIPTAISIDPFSDTIWLGSANGSVSAWCSPVSLSRNVHFPAHGAQQMGGLLHPGYSPAVKEIRVTDREIWTLTEGGIGGRKKGGLVKWNVRCVASRID
jgi:PAB-dependent poly(A)-specific ribonuclease subunit 2